MVREELVTGVRAALQSAQSQEIPARQEGLRARIDGRMCEIAIEAIPVRTGLNRADLFMVVFEEATQPASAPESEKPPSDLADASAAAQEIMRLQQELAATREYLQSVIEQQEAANEELQSANEEVQSSNEELQSINEELETSKEELQSSNEELSTVNDELSSRNAELAQSNDDFLNLLSSAQLPIVMLDAKLRIRRFTPAAEKLLNLLRTDIGRPLSDIKLNFDVPDVDQLIVDVVDTMSAREREVQDRHGRWYLLRIRPYRTLENRIEGAVLALIDVDTLKRNQETLRQQTELLNQAYEPIVMWEIGGVISYWNRAAEDAYGYTRDEALGASLHELLKVTPPLESFRRELELDGHWTGEFVHTRRDGQKIIVESRMVVVGDVHGRKLVVEANRPITERKESETVLRRLADDLVTADRHKDEFLAMLAHELRNPLAPLRNIVSVLRSPELKPHDKTRALDVMDRQVSNMARLVDDLLDVSRITLSQIALRKEPIDVVAAVQRTVEQHESSVRARGQSIALELPGASIFAEADPVRLEQIVGNLLDNACKYTQPGGRITIEVENAAAAQGTGREAVISVRDNGIGISAEKLPHVFDLFMRATRSIDHQYGGLGIGLTLVRRLTELHGGTVEARSAGPGLGSEFIVRLPTGGAGANVDEPVGETEQLLARRLRILIVDDSADNAESLALALRLSQHEVEVAASGKQALEVAPPFKPDVCLIDIGMPQMDGCELAVRLRELPAARNVRLIALSGYGQVEAKQRARDAGFDDYLVKPASAEDLRRMLGRDQK
jgi:two-component system CheB/CheR fusion protein